jgi:hypothetical protein
MTLATPLNLVPRLKKRIELRSEIFWDFPQRRMVIPYRRFRRSQSFFLIYINITGMMNLKIINVQTDTGRKILEKIYIMKEYDKGAIYHRLFSTFTQTTS